VDAVNLFRLFGYAVHPQRTTPDEELTAPTGGRIDVVATVSSLLDEALARAQREQPTRVKLRVRPDGSRSSLVRDAVIEFAFASSANVAEPAAERLAEKLSRSMDLRSFSGLFLVAGYRTNARDRARQVALWVFPRDDVLRFESQRHRIEVVQDVFSRTSQQRKLALLKGRNARGQFHQADVLDFQARGRVGDLAAFWVEEFLEADPLLTDIAGTRFLADVFVRTSAKLEDPDELDRVHAAVVGLRHGPVLERSIDQLANSTLEGEAREVFIREAAARLPNPDVRRTRFRLERDTFAETLGFRMFRTRTGARVVAPIEEAGRTWELEERPADAAGDQTEQVLRLEDVVISDKLRRGRVA
jgi:hypothetical protein